MTPCDTHMETAPSNSGYKFLHRGRRLGDAIASCPAGAGETANNEGGTLGRR
jgi:hypothetical protein